MRLSRTIGFLAAALFVASLQAQQTTLDPATRQLAHDIFKQLIEINSTDSIGSTTAVADAMRKRLLDAGFAPADVVVIGPNARKGNLVARLRARPGTTLKPVLIIGHTDVVEARREDWTTDPFVFTEKDGFFYGRGTQDMKDSDAAMVTSFIRLKREGYVPDRDLILALTADEEGGSSNGVDWLLKNHRDLIDAEFVINPDAGGVTTKNGKPILLGVEATEKLYADYHVTATNPGGHSSLPTGDNAIYHVADALGRLEKSPFPFELNEVTRAELKTRATLAQGQEAEDLRAILKTPPDPAAIQRLSAKPVYNATMRTTCVATMMSAGHAPNALPGRAEANVNCRILPGHSQEEVRQDLIRIFADPTLTVEYTTDSGKVLGKGSDRVSAPPPPLKEAIFKPLRETVQLMWPGLTILPEMETGASDSIYTMAAGLPSYGFSGMAIEEGDERAHGRDERLGVESYYTGVEFDYLYLKAMTGGK
jgi:acetylornithine deacetylase/succinyl-diaminopimelate desuccinylase-like protein